jgi:hypothetical protein
LDKIKSVVGKQNQSLIPKEQTYYKAMKYLLSGKLDLNRVNGFLPTCFSMILSNPKIQSPLAFYIVIMCNQVISYENYYPYGGTAIIAGKDKTEVQQKRYRYTDNCLL